MAYFSDGLLNVKMFVPYVERLLLNNTHGLRAATNNKGIITGNQIRFPLGDSDGMAKAITKGSPIVPEDVIVSDTTATITNYEASCRIYPQDLAATNSEASIRQIAAEKVYNSMENRFTQCVLDALAQYDDTNMEVGSASTAFTVSLLDQINLKANNAYWGNGNKFMLLPHEAQYTLMQDSKFYEIWSLVNGKSMIDNMGKTTDDDLSIKWTPYRGFYIGFMGKKTTSNQVGLPVASDTSLMGYAWKANRVGFGMNQGLETRISIMDQFEGNPLVFKTNGSCGSCIIDTKGVIGIKLDATPLS